MPKPILLIICERDVDDDPIEHRFEITVVDGRAEIRDVDHEAIVQRGPNTALTVGVGPDFAHLELRVEVR